MCGIIGYVGRKQADPVLLEGLKKLEYRGYDSGGIGLLSTQGKIVLRKMQGKLQNLEGLMAKQPFPEGFLGISHTRWATHGVPNKVNSHPHRDCSGKILIVHNGIIENYEELKLALEKKGHKFLSDTDTEIIAHLIEDNYKKDLVFAVQKSIAKLRGAFALGVICTDHPGLLVAARIGSPLIIGLGKKENFIASDVPAILNHTKKIIYLKDGEMATLTQEKVEVFDFKGNKVKPKVDTIKFSVEAVQKQGYAHFMLKEMHEQPSVLAQMIKARIKRKKVVLDGLALSEAT
ncbi:Glutamine--fructose-6-phosphate aminotransferase [isomerizing], partial [hydrothermal vent metagenome]